MLHRLKRHSIPITAWFKHSLLVIGYRGSWRAVLVLAVRLYVQWFVYSREVSRGHPLNTLMHWLFTGLWAYYGVALWL